MDVVVYDKIGKESDRLENLLLATFPQKTITDAPIASFADGADDIPIKQLSVAIEPVQDLHGQDAPYPAGGGKNKFKNTASDLTTNGIAYTVQDDGTVIANGTATGSAILRIGVVTLSPENYVLSGLPSNGGPGTFEIMLTNEAYSVNVDDLYTTSGLNIDVTEETTYGLQIIIRTGQTMSGFKFTPMIRLATETDATFAPYSNICPISGHTSANVARTGINVWDEEWELGVYSTADGEPSTSASNVRSKSTNYIHVVPNTSYYFKTNGYVMEVYEYNADKVYIGKHNVTDEVFTLTQNTHYIRFDLASGYGTTYNHDISINYPSTDTSYHPYQGTTYPITFPSGTTVYGGNITVNQDGSGELVVDKWYVDINTSPSVTFHTGTINSIWVSFERDKRGYAYATHAISNMYKMGGNSAPHILFYETECDIYDSRFTDLETARALLADFQFVYALKTPLAPIPLTAPQITTLLGQNNIWADTGNIESLAYRANLGDYINNAITTAVANALNV